MSPLYLEGFKLWFEALDMTVDLVVSYHYYFSSNSPTATYSHVNFIGELSC